jgi:hypothetical protein
MKKTPAEKYLSEVRNILEKSDHPRKSDVLEDLQIHLKEIELNENPVRDVEELHRRLGSPEDYAEGLEPYSNVSPIPSRRTKYFSYGIGIVVVVFVLGFTASSNRQTIAAHYRTVAGKNFHASPFFDMGRLRALKPGASADEIRDAVGYPINRWQIQGKEDVVYWLYTKTPKPESPFYTRVLLTTDADELNLIDWDIDKDTNEGGMGASNGIIVPPGENVGSLTFSRPDGEDVHANDWTLDADDENLYVIDPRHSITSLDELNQIDMTVWREYVTKHWKDIPLEKIKFVHIVGSRGKLNSSKLDNILRNLPKEARIYSGNYVPMEVFGSGPHEIKLYSYGTLYDYPVVPLGNPIVEKAAWDDRMWVIQKLISRHH